MSVSPPKKTSTEHTEDTEKDFRRMIKTSPSAISHQPSNLRPQTSDFIFALHSLQLTILQFFENDFFAFETQVKHRDGSCSLRLWNRTHPLCLLPSDNLIYNFLLLQATSSQIDTCCLDAFMPHEVGKQGYIVELLQEILGITMAE